MSPVDGLLKNLAKCEICNRYYSLIEEKTPCWGRVVCQTCLGRAIRKAINVPSNFNLMGPNSESEYREECAFFCGATLKYKIGTDFYTMEKTVSPKEWDKVVRAFGQLDTI